MKFIYQGGPLFMVPLLILLMIIIVLFIKSLKKNSEKDRKLINELGLFSFAFGVLGFVIGLLGALGDIAQASDISPQVLAGGFKVGLIAPTFGMIIFLIGRIESILLIQLKK